MDDRVMCRRMPVDEWTIVFGTLSVNFYLDF